jgi:hypothetical protein
MARRGGCESASRVAPSSTTDATTALDGGGISFSMQHSCTTFATRFTMLVDALARGIVPLFSPVEGGVGIGLYWALQGSVAWRGHGGGFLLLASSKGVMLSSVVTKEKSVLVQKGQSLGSESRFAPGQAKAVACGPVYRTGAGGILQHDSRDDVCIRECVKRGWPTLYRLCVVSTFLSAPEKHVGSAFAGRVRSHSVRGGRR